MGIINRVSMLTLMPIFGISQGTQPVIGYNYGAKNYGRVKEAVVKGSVAATAVSVVGFITVQLFDTHIIRLFSSESDLVALGASGLKIFMAMLPIIGFQVIGSTFFQAIGKPMHSLLLSMSRQLLILSGSLILRANRPPGVGSRAAVRLAPRCSPRLVAYQIKKLAGVEE
jgi:Na+-driven multidrug efflux pump